jgi:two-component sensor histidine kinase
LPPSEGFWGRGASRIHKKAIQELTTNAHKHGVLGGEEGTITIEWMRSAGGKAILSWAEEGAPSVNKSPQTSGFRTQILQALFPDSKLDFTPAGLQFSGSLYVR